MKKRLIALLLVLVMLVGATACGAKEETTDTPSSSTNTPATSEKDNTNTDDVELEYTIQWYVSTSAIENGTAEVIRNLFTAKYPQYDVNIIEMDGNDTQSQLLTMIAAGETVDCVYDYTENIVSGGVAGTYVDLAPYFAADGEDFADMFGSLAASVLSNGDGGYYGLPHVYNTFKVFYNKTMLDEAGITIPADGVWSWDEFVAAAEAMHDPDNGVWGCVWPSTWTDTYVALAACAGWNYTYADADGNVIPNFDDEVLKDAMTKVRDLAFVQGLTPDMNTIRAESLNRRVYYATQQAAMIVDGPYTFQWMKNYMFNDPGEGELEFEVGVAEIPYLEGGENCSFATVVGAWGVPKTTGNAEASYRFVHFIETEDVNAAAANGAYLSCYTKWEEQGSSYEELNYKVFSNDYLDINGEVHNDIYSQELVNQLTNIPREFHQVYWNFDLGLSSANSLMYTLIDEQASLFMGGEMEFDEWAAMCNDLAAEQLATAGLDKLN